MVAVAGSNGTIYEGEPAWRRLAQLGLDRQDLVAALVGAHQEAGRYQSVDDAKNASGLVRWARTVGLLRHRLSGKGWRREDPQNLPIAVDPPGKVTIITTTGDSATGYRYGDQPKTQYPKGRATAVTVSQDSEAAEQLSFMDMLDDELAEEMSRVVAAESERREVWFLLYHFNKSSGALRAELSRPASMEPGQQVGEWRERIMLGGIDLDMTQSDD